ncbi:hypothetical protein [Clostridium sp.]|uniref:hypothetical protein n=1 Tax=Clostridium sp. TaxID=1506 RepID=UPI003464D266
MKEGYYPQWYIKNLRCTNKKNIIRTLIYFFIFFIIISMGIVGNYCKRSNIADKVQYNKNIVSNSNKKNITAFMYNYIYDVILKEDLEIITMNIDGNNVTFNIKIKDKEDYSMCIKMLEEKFTIVEVSSILQEKEELYFRAKVKINGY